MLVYVRPKPPSRNVGGDILGPQLPRYAGEPGPWLFAGSGGPIRSGGFGVRGSQVLTPRGRLIICAKSAGCTSSNELGRFEGSVSDSLEYGFDVEVVGVDVFESGGAYVGQVLVFDGVAFVLVGGDGDPAAKRRGPCP